VIEAPGFQPGAFVLSPSTQGGFMREIIPACPKCKSNKYVVRLRTAEKVGTVCGGAVGAGSAYAGLTAGAAKGAVIGSVIPGLGTMAGAGIGAISGTIMGFLSGCAVGNAVGERIDANIRMKYRCTHCGSKIQG